MSKNVGNNFCANIRCNFCDNNNSGGADSSVPNVERLPGFVYFFLFDIDTDLERRYKYNMYKYVE